MKEILKHLLGLSKIDLALHHLTEEHTSMPVSNTEIQQEIKSLQEQIIGKKTELADCQNTKKELSSFIDEKNQWIQDRESRLNDLKTQKEYQAVQKEITLAKKEIKDKETQLDSIGPKLDVLTNEIMLLTEKCEPKIKEAEFTITENNARATLLKTEIEKLSTERKHLREQVTDHQYLKHYEHILKRAVPALSEIQGNICAECGTRLLPQSINIVKVGKSMQYCPRCKRILYIADMLDMPS